MGDVHDAILDTADMIQGVILTDDLLHFVLRSFVPFLWILVSSATRDKKPARGIEINCVGMDIQSWCEKGCHTRATCVKSHGMDIQSFISCVATVTRSVLKRVGMDIQSRFGSVGMDFQSGHAYVGMDFPTL